MQLEILSQSDSNTLNGLIQAANNIVICCHKSPDGDAIGSSLAWAEYLRQVGKEPLIIVPDAFPDFLRWLPGVEEVMRYDKHTAVCKERIAEADLMVSLPQMSSTCEIVFRIVWQLGGFEMFSRQAAIAVYCGMMTDTGGFTYNSTRPEIYVIIGHLLTKGFDKDKVYRNVYNNYSSWAIRFRGYLMSQKLNVLNELNASYFCITRQDMKNFHFVKGDAEGLVNEPLRIKGQKLVISLREDTDKDNLILVSLRSVDDFPCNEMAERFFNGGGHLNASGGKLFCSMSEAERVVRDAIMAYSGRLRA